VFERLKKSQSRARLRPSAATRERSPTGGSIGTWHFFTTLTKCVEGLKEMVDHVSIGTDQSAKQEFALTGVEPSQEETGKIAGSRHLQIFLAALG